MEITVGFAVYPIRLTRHRPRQRSHRSRLCDGLTVFDTNEILIYAGLSADAMALTLIHEIEEVFERHFPPTKNKHKRRDWEAQVHLTAQQQIDAQGGLEALAAMTPVDHPLAPPPPEAEEGLRSA